MEYKLLGRTGVKVSSLCFGTGSFGGIADKKTSEAMFHRCREVGINFFDTANSYNNGRAEEILECQKLSRGNYPCFKVGELRRGYQWTGIVETPHYAGGRNSLRRLGTDHVALLVFV